MSEQHDAIIDAEFNGKQVEEKSGGLVLATDVLPAGLPIIPIRPRPAFPNMVIPVTVNDGHQVQAVKRAMESHSATTTWMSPLIFPTSCSSPRPTSSIPSRRRFWTGWR